MDPWSLLRTQLVEWGIPCDDARVKAFRTFYDLLLEGNRRANLTRITDETEAIVKHFLDSLSVLTILEPQERDRALTLIDIGAGAGFPAIPLLLMQRDWRGTLVDSTRKKVDFMHEAIASLGLQATAQHARAEEIGQDSIHREAYDLAVARAVAELNVLCELCLPCVKVGGAFVAMKASGAEEELAAADRAIRTLGGRLEEVRSFSLPACYGQRMLIRIRKVSPTPKAYPRRVGQPSAKPLC